MVTDKYTVRQTNNNGNNEIVRKNRRTTDRQRGQTTRDKKTNTHTNRETRM